MSKNKLNSHFPAAVDDVNAGPFADIQKRLDDIQDSGMTALAIRNILFQKMLDLHAVPDDHFLRSESTPERLDDPSLIAKLNDLGFYRASTRVMH